MADPLLYNALDAYLYSDTQLAAATSQAQTQEAIRAAGVPLLQCCICCACLCQQQLTNCSTSGGPGGSQEIVDQYSTCWSCYDTLYDNACSGGSWVTCCFMYPANEFGQCSSNGIMCCQWTVPANVNCVQFDLWGAGGPSWGSTCCGYSIYGATGAFASVVIPTCAGWTYTLCVGCSYCCGLSDYNQVGNYYGFNNGHPSCICGCGLQMLALGGKSASQQHLWDNVSIFGTRPNQCFGNKCGGTGSCYCNGGYACFQSCSSCGEVGVSRAQGVNAFICSCKPDSITSAHSPNLSTSEGFTVPGHWGGYCLANDFNGWFIAPRPPRYHQDCSHYCIQWQGGNCCGGNCCNYGQGYMSWPGSGGMASISRSGACRCGDGGNGGGVRVSYRTC